ncbi:MAG: zinc-binding dehydrogenase [Gemmatimonadota bacterium]|nr:zinc-binding dehydrogenase [Gemmatimonadota bacterium]MDE2871125.1 zinc-binding dehydrogenase [Gemmatimonadota bacterium]
MKAVEFNVTIPGFILARGPGRFSSAFVYGRPSGVSLVDRPPPAIPGDDWVRIEVLLCGICGSDLGNISYRSSPAMEPFGSFPAVPGHEILGRVVEVGAGVSHVEPGQRVVVDPMLHCEARGWGAGSWCTSCVTGNHATCELSGEEGPLEMGGGALARGLTIGYHRDLPGGWGEQMIAHRRQVFPVPASIPDRVAVLAEPLAIGMHGVLRSGALRSRGPVLVIGSGAIAFATIWALRALGYGGRLVAQAKRAHEVSLAVALGADETMTPGEEAREALVRTGARAYMPVVGDEVYAGGGFDTIFDCVGTRGSVDQALRHAAARGRVVMLGCAGEIRKLDLTFLWARELRVQGYVGYGTETWENRSLHTFGLTLEKMAADPRALGELVTHVFPLAQYRDALRAAFDHRRSGAVKVALQPRRAPPGARAALSAGG